MEVKLNKILKRVNESKEGLSRDIDQVKNMVSSIRNKMVLLSIKFETLEKTCLDLKEEINKIRANIKEDNIEMKIQTERLDQNNRCNNLLINESL